MKNLRHRPEDMTCEIKRTGFYSQGTRCAATLHLPEQQTDALLPAILMVHGWGGVQHALTTPFCEEFTRAGFAVMTFDYRGWGESAGLPRNTINSHQRVKDADAALAHLKSLASIDPTRIVLWGTSFGGGHVVELAAEHPGLAGAIAQVPMLNGLDAVRAVPYGRLMRFALYSLADILKPGRPIYIPVVAQPGDFASMDRDDAGKALEQGMESVQRPYDNRIAARSLMTMGQYRPFQRLKDIRIPTVIIGASRDTVAPFSASAIQNVGNPKIRLKTLEANHFEPYFKPVFSTLINLELDFLRSLDLTGQSKK